MTDYEVRLDFDRARRLGFDEAILCAHKSGDQIEVILERVHGAGRSCLLTRLSAGQFEQIADRYRAMIDFDEVSETAFFNHGASPAGDPALAVVTAGSSDVKVAREAMRTLEYHGVGAQALFDVGVAGLWRLLEHLDAIRAHPVVIVAAGMDAALPSVLGGLFPGLVIAVPTSTGYGVAAGGRTALHAMLASCAPGIVTVNIDNGYGAACAALRALNRLGDARATDQTASSAPGEQA